VKHDDCAAFFCAARQKCLERVAVLCKPSCLRFTAVPLWMAAGLDPGSNIAFTKGLQSVFNRAPTPDECSEQKPEQSSCRNDEADDKL